MHWVNSSGSYDTVYVEDLAGTLLARSDDDGTFYYHPDHLGSTRLITDSGGSIDEELMYLPFGASLEGEDRYTFTGQESDPETDLMYYNTRYYSPYLRQFTQPDWIIPNRYNPQLLNRYTYVRNNPVKYVDPTGNILWFVFLPAVAAGVYSLYHSARTPQKSGADIAIDAFTSTTETFITASISPAIKGVNGIRWYGYSALRSFGSGAAGSGIGTALNNGLKGNRLSDNLGRDMMIGGFTNALTSSFMNYKSGQYAPHSLNGFFTSKTGRSFIAKSLLDPVISTGLKDLMNSEGPVEDEYYPGYETYYDGDLSQPVCLDPDFINPQYSINNPGQSIYNGGSPGGMSRNHPRDNLEYQNYKGRRSRLPRNGKSFNDAVRAAQRKAAEGGSS